MLYQVRYNRSIFLLCQTNYIPFTNIYIYVYMCVYVCMYVCMYVRMYNQSQNSWISWDFTGTLIGSNMYWTDTMLLFSTSYELSVTFFKQSNSHSSITGTNHNCLKYQNLWKNGNSASWSDLLFVLYLSEGITLLHLLLLQLWNMAMITCNNFLNW